MCLLSKEGRSKALAQTLHGSMDLDRFVLAIAEIIGGEIEHSSDSPSSELFGCNIDCRHLTKDNLYTNGTI
jgi:hypothetical protein